MHSTLRVPARWCSPLQTRIRGLRVRVLRAAAPGQQEETATRKNPLLYAETKVDESQLSSNVLARKPEILAPAGGWPQLKAAVQAGADAVYFGLDAFNARARAANFELIELPAVMEYLHTHGVLGYVAMNVLVFDNELEAVEERTRAMADAGVDAVIVQDVGVVRLMRAAAPSLPIHGSTQMSITSAEGAQFAAALGVSRVVAGRELSVRELGAVKSGTSAELEAFCHGALCVSYSGQCFSSEAWGGRSANRGQCAQACRMPYGLVVDGQLADLKDVRYLLSPQDLAAIDLVPGMVEAGVACFKIEGRLKGPEYVAVTTQLYRAAVDAAWAARHGGGAAPFALTQQQRWDMEQVFARGQDAVHSGLTPGFLEGPRHQRLVRGRGPRHRGVHVGVVEGVTARGVRVLLDGPVQRGAGLVFDAGSPETEEEGGSVYEVWQAGQQAEGLVSEGPVELTFGAGALRLPRIARGHHVWRSADPVLSARVAAATERPSEEQRRRVPVSVALTGAAGEPLRVTVRTDGPGPDGQPLCAFAETAALLVEARSKRSDEAALMAAVGTLGGTPFRCSSCDASALAMGPPLFVPASEVKAARRAAVEALAKQLNVHSRAASIAAEPQLPLLLAAARQQWSGSVAEGETRQPAIRALCRTAAQARAALTVPWLEEVTLEFLEIHGLAEAVAEVRAAGRRVVVATPRVLKPDEERLWRFYLRLDADALLVRSAGMLHRLVGELGGPGAEAQLSGGVRARVPELQGDFSLNVANTISAAAFLELGLERLAPTHDLSAAQVAALARSLGPGGAARLEAVIHQHLPVFHTEACAFARFLSDGDSHKDCGHPCETKTLHLRDSEGADNLVLADMGCRNTVFNAAAQSGADYLALLAGAGVGNLRVEFVDEPPELVPLVLQAYADALAGKRTAASLTEWLKQLPDSNGRVHGVTRGSLESRAEKGRDTLKPTATAARANIASRTKSSYVADW